MLTAQAAYVDQTLGDESAAKKAYDTLFSFKSELEPAVAAVAANNMIKIRGQRDFFDSWKKCRANLSDSLGRKITPAQRQAFLHNAALLSMHMNKADQCKELLATISSEFPDSDSPALIRAAMLVQRKQLEQAEAALEEAASKSKRPTTALLTLAQLQLNEKQPDKAIATLSRAAEVKGRPGMVGTLVALHEREGDIDAAAACFEGASSEQLLRASGAFHTHYKRWPAAAAAYRKLLELNARDLEAIAGLVVAVSHTDPAEAETLWTKLEMLSPEARALTEELDAEPVDALALDLAGPLSRPKRAERGAARDGEGGEGGRRHKKRRKKKIIYPKGFDPENPSAFPKPDPERWLPKRERSTYRKSKKEKRQGISRGPQGSSSGAGKEGDRVTTNIQTLSEAERAKKKEEDEARERGEAAAAAAAAASSGRKKKSKPKDKF